jgi:hypothetical protein
LQGQWSRKVVKWFAGGIADQSQWWCAKRLCTAGSHSPEATVQSDPDFSRIPILAIHPDRDPDFSDPDFSDPNFSNPNLGLSSRNLTTDIFKKKLCQKWQTLTFCEVSQTLSLDMGEWWDPSNFPMLKEVKEWLGQMEMPLDGNGHNTTSSYGAWPQL